MTDDQIIELAKEDRVRSEYTEFGWQDCDRYEFDANELITFARRIAVMQREIDAGIADDMDYSPDGAIGKHIKEQSDE